MKIAFLLIAFILGIVHANADEKKKVITYQTLPSSTIRDYSAPAYVTETDKKGNVITYQTLPGSTVRDYRAPAYVQERSKK